MPSRINLETLVNSTLMNMQLSASRMHKLQEQIATGKKIIRPSDDPDGARKILNFRSEDLKLEQLSENVQTSMQSIQFSESILQNTADTINRVQELIVQGVNPTTAQGVRDVIAKEIDGMLESVLSNANSTRLGRYIFAGTETSTRPFETTRNANGEITAVTYMGNREKIEYSVGPGTNVQVNHTGAEVFMDSKIFTTLMAIRDSLVAGALEFAKAGLDDIVVVQEGIMDSIVKAGAIASNLEFTDNRIKDAKISVAAALGEIEGADIAEVVLKLKEQETIFQAALASGVLVFQTSILDYF